MFYSLGRCGKAREYGAADLFCFWFFPSARAPRVSMQSYGNSDKKGNKQPNMHALGKGSYTTRRRCLPHYPHFSHTRGYEGFVSRWEFISCALKI